MKLYAAFSSLVLSTTLLAQPALTPATKVFIDGNIYTMNEKQPHAEAVAVKNDKIIFIGNNVDAKKYIGKKTKIINLHGATLLPGFTDSHYHFIGVGDREMKLNLANTTNLNEFLKAVEARVAKAKPGEWILGGGWNETLWKEGIAPTRADLDRVAPNNPVYLDRTDWHCAVVNSAALKLAGIDKNTQDPFGGKIQHDPQTGEPNGLLLDAAVKMVTDHVPSATLAQMQEAMLKAQQRSFEVGLTQVQEPKGTYKHVDLYKKLYAQHLLKIRIYKAVSGPGKEADRLLRDGPIIEAYDHRFNVRAIKVVSDGALGSRGAALLAPYSDAADTTGLMTVKQDDYQRMLQKALRVGIQVQTHAIGDKANRFVLDQYQQAFEAVPVAERKYADPRWRDEHTQIVNPVDLPRFAKMGIIASMQPSHAIGDLHYASQRLGMERLKGAYAWNTLISSGVKVIGGSDAPVERGEPMIEYYGAVARKDLQGFSGEGWHPEEAVSREIALKMFTLWPAYAAFEENLRGSIEVGKLADFTILSADITKIPAQDILKTQCIMTVVGGEIVYQRSAGKSYAS